MLDEGLAHRLLVLLPFVRQGVIKHLGGFHQVIRHRQVSNKAHEEPIVEYQIKHTDEEVASRQQPEQTNYENPDPKDVRKVVYK